MPSGLYEEFAAAYVRGMCPDAPAAASVAELLEHGRSQGLKLHRFKRSATLPRVRAVLGMLRAVSPSTLADIGSGRGVFLWPLMDAFPWLSVTAIERDERRLAHLEAVRRGGMERLQTRRANAADLPFAEGAFDVVTVLEVLEHQRDPLPLAREAARVAGRFVIASVPSKADDNPEHVQLFTSESLSALLLKAGAHSVKIEHVLNHIVAIARITGGQ
jgi:2-polyprenyl-3-methyl-5-hydroxy-6-metoxy-1,4-benzoquinol methylase